MTNRKKIISFVLISLLIVTSMLLLCSCVDDYEEYHGDGVYAILYRNGTARVYAFDKALDAGWYDAQICIVPSIIEDDGKTYTVTAFGGDDDFTKALVNDGGHAKEIVIPETVTEIELDYYSLSDTFDYLERFTVDSDNPQYKSENGVLYNKDGSRLIMYPPAKKDTTFVIPSQLAQIDSVQYNYCNKYIKEIEVEKGNAFFKVCDNALYSIDGETLVYVPYGHSENLALPDGIVTIDYCALRYANIVNLYVPQRIFRDEQNDYQFILNVVYDSRRNLSDNHPFRYVRNVYFYDGELPKFLNNINLPYTEFHFGVSRDAFWETVGGSVESDGNLA
ncbi:MAG: hypothetical protein J1F65_05380 [Clostridiales bacterium]|nr:hypothetical protein [Clostridiales bacterium]